ncbi:hypothetical protein R20943_03084 [Paraburkholderia aspalathi]|nr:hypothetical protein R20943_03084 [Paraburkholderia aspalathi]
MKMRQKNLVLTFVSSVITAVLLGGCITNAPSSQTDERDLSGTYKVVNQSRKQSLQAESVEIKFFRSAADVNGGLSAGYLKLAGPSVPDGWAYPVCAYPGDRLRSNFAGDADPANIEVIRCSNPRNIRSMPVAFLVGTKNKSPFHYSSGLLDVWNKSLEVTTGRLLIINWGPDSESAYVLQAD